MPESVVQWLRADGGQSFGAGHSCLWATLKNYVESHNYNRQPERGIDMTVNATTACDGCGKLFDADELSYCPTCDWHICPDCDCPHPLRFDSDADKREYIELMAEKQREMDAAVEPILESLDGV